MVRTEEERFHETINEGLSMLNEVIKEVKDAKGDTLDGKLSSNFMILLASRRINGRSCGR